MIPAEEFLGRYIDTNTPVVIRGLVEHWPAYRLWERAYLGEKLAPFEVPLTESFKDGSGRIAQVYRVRFAEVAPMLLEGRVDLPHFYLAQIRLPDSLASDIELPPYIPAAVASPPNIWIGPRGSLTPLHCDGRHNILAQVRGRKKLTLFSPADWSYLYYEDTEPPKPIKSRVDLRHPDFEKFPLFAKATPFEVVLEQGEALFLPQGWAHFVEGLDRTISVNFWWKVHLRHALVLGLTEARNDMAFDSLGSPLKTLCHSFDVCGLDEFDIAACLSESGRKPRAAQVAYELVDKLLYWAHEKASNRELPLDQAPAIDPIEATRLASSGWKTRWTPSDRAHLLNRLAELRETGHVPERSHRLLSAFLGQAGGDDGSFEKNVASSLDLNELLAAMRDTAAQLQLTRFFSPPPPRVTPADMAFRSYENA